MTRQQWVSAGLKALASAGVESVHVEVLARSLRVSKGSFYWHFKDRADLLEAILLVWGTRGGTIQR